MSKNRWWPDTTSPEERGKLAEEHFFKAWEVRKLPPWIVSVCRPTRHEDLKEKTDAVIVQTSGPNLRIQIKSFWIPSKQRIELMEYGVIPLSIGADDSLQRIRQKTHNALRSYRSFQRKLETQPKQFTKKKRRWRKRLY